MKNFRWIAGAHDLKNVRVSADCNAFCQERNVLGLLLKHWADPTDPEHV